MGVSPEGSSYNTKEGMHFHQGSKNFGDFYLNNSMTLTTKPKKISLKNDIVLSVRAPVGPINLNVFDEICIGRGLAAIRANEEIIKYEYLFYYLYENQNLFIGNQGATISSINKNEISEFKIKVPDIKTQEKISQELNNQIEYFSSTKKLILNTNKKINEIISKLYKS
tara:strand:- start:391 stop:894 length:504 start_codon:yes stop_codon:yes gene_type:complete